MSRGSGNKFEHIVYEFYIYLTSYEYISSANSDIRNIAFECHVIHLRNLSYFFGKSKKKNGWHVSEVLTMDGSIPLLSGKMAERINQYASRTAGHLGDERLGADYKDQTSLVFFNAFSRVRASIEGFLSNADNLVRPELYSDWKDADIQDQVRRVLCQLAFIDSGYVQALGPSSMMSAPTTSMVSQHEFAPVYILGTQASLVGQSF